MNGYQEDLAYVHEVSASHSRKCSPGVLEILRQSGVRDGLVVDLGCGSGHWARDLLDAGYDVIGVDSSGPLIELARKRAPEATFRKQSFLKTRLPACDAVTALGEIVNYQFDRSSTRQALRRFFGDVYAALRPGGLFIFDFAEPGRHPQPRQFIAQGKDWLCCADISEDPVKETVTREIVTFRRVGELFRRSKETHRLKLYRGVEIADELRELGFRVRVRRGYGKFRFRDQYNAYVALIARKPLG